MNKKLFYPTKTINIHRISRANYISKLDVDEDTLDKILSIRYFSILSDARELIEDIDYSESAQRNYYKEAIKLNSVEDLINDSEKLISMVFIEKLFSDLISKINSKE